MKILWLSSHLPKQGISGGRSREWEIIKRLSKDFQIYLGISSKVYKKDHQEIYKISSFVKEVQVFPCSEGAQRIIDREISFLEKQNYSSLLATWVEKTLLHKSIDLIHVENAYIIRHLPSDISHPLVVVEHNIESDLAHQYSKLVDNFDETQAWLKEYTLLRELENHAHTKASKIVVVSNADRNRLIQATPIFHKKLVVVSNGINHKFTINQKEYNEAISLKTKTGLPTSIFVANFAYAPNLDALEFLMKSIIPVLETKKIEIGFWIVGNSIPNEFSQVNSHKNVSFINEVESIYAWLAAADFVIIPLRYGGGIKIKTLEAINTGQAIVSTSIGIDGIKLTRDDILIGDDANTFAHHIINVAHNQETANTLRLRARLLRETLPSWDEAAAKLSELYYDLISKGNNSE